MYGISQKYNLKDYVEFYSAHNGNGKPCHERFGYIVGIEYRCDRTDKVELSYVISDFIGSSGGIIVSQDQIIKKHEPKVKDYGYKEYLENKIKAEERMRALLDSQK